MILLALQVSNLGDLWRPADAVTRDRSHAARRTSGIKRLVNFFQAQLCDDAVRSQSSQRKLRMTTTLLDAIERKERFRVRRVYRRIIVEQRPGSGRTVARHPRPDRANKLGRSVDDHAVPQIRPTRSRCRNMEFCTSISRAQPRLTEVHSEFESRQWRSVVSTCRWNDSDLILRNGPRLYLGKAAYRLRRNASVC
jgi:hypothetical protein